MYSQIFCLIILMLIINFALEVSQGLLNFSSTAAVFLTVGGYFLCLGMIAFQSLFFRPKNYGQIERMSLLTNLELLTVFFLIFLVIGIQTHFPQLTGSLTLLSAGSMALYFAGIALFRYLSEPNAGLRIEKATKQILFLLPFLIPYFTLTLILDIGSLFFGSEEDLAFTLAALALLILSLLFLPYFLQKFWQCSPLPKGELNQKLEALCEKAQFKHGGMKVWTVMGRSLTAAIIGIIPRFRYVMFTPKLLAMLAPEHIEAVLAHEIGHSKHRHLIWYPVIIFGMMVSIALFFDIAGTSSLHPIALFFCYAVIMALYFRFVFGYFSRLFERQADLYGLELGLALNSMIGALDHIAISAGNIHHLPSWHHFGIQERIDYLERVGKKPELIAKHHRKVKLSLALYLLLLILGIIKLIWY